MKGFFFLRDSQKSPETAAFFGIYGKASINKQNQFSGGRALRCVWLMAILFSQRCLQESCQMCYAAAAAAAAAAEEEALEARTE